MMQTFRNSAKIAGAVFALLMLIFVLTSVDWRGLGTTTTVGKIDGQSIDARTYQTAVQQAIDNRQRESAAALTLEDRTQIEDQVWDQFVDGRVLEAEYRRRHDEIWPELVDVIRGSGVRNYSLFRRGTQVIAYCECEPDVATAFGKIGATEVNARWSAWFEDVIVSLTDEDGNLFVAEEVWHLD